MKNEINDKREITPRMLSADEPAKYIGLVTKMRLWRIAWSVKEF